MANGVIYSSDFRFYVERIERAGRLLGPDAQPHPSLAEFIERYLIQQGVTVVDDRLDTGSPLA